MFPLIPLIGAALGLVKTGSDALGAERDKKVQSATTRYSPWTNMVAKEPRRVDPIGNTMAGFSTGALLDQGGLGNALGLGGGAEAGAGAAAGAAGGSIGSGAYSVPSQMDTSYFSKIANNQNPYAALLNRNIAGR